MYNLISYSLLPLDQSRRNNNLDIQLSTKYYAPKSQSASRRRLHLTPYAYVLPCLDRQEILLQTGSKVQRTQLRPMYLPRAILVLHSIFGASLGNKVSVLVHVINRRHLASSCLPISRPEEATLEKKHKRFRRRSHAQP